MWTLEFDDFFGELQQHFEEIELQPTTYPDLHVLVSSLKVVLPIAITP